MDGEMQGAYSDYAESDFDDVSEGAWGNEDGSGSYPYSGGRPVRH